MVFLGGGGEKERGLACFCSFSLFFALQSSASLGEIGEDAGGGGGGGGLKSRGVLMAWSPSVGGGGGAVEPSDTESIESRESAKSRDTSPSHSPIVSMKTFQNYPASEVRRSHTYWSNNNYCLFSSVKYLYVSQPVPVQTNFTLVGFLKTKTYLKK